jgi:hypothetical protein
MAVMDRVRRGEHDLSGLDGGVLTVVEAALHPEPAQRPNLRTVIESLEGRHTRERILPRDAPKEGYYAGLAGEASTLAFEAPTRAETAPPMAPLHEPYQMPPPPPPARVPVSERLRRLTLGLGLLAVVTAGAVAAPYVTAVLVAAGAGVLRWFSVIGSSASARRQTRGPKWYDGLVTTLTTPVDLVASVPGTVMLLCIAGSLAASCAAVCLAAGVPAQQGLAAVGAMLGLSIWFAPGGRRVRSSLQRIGLPVARVPWYWVIGLVCLGAVTAGLLWNVLDSGTSWPPSGGAPWRQGTWLGRHV